MRLAGSLLIAAVTSFAVAAPAAERQETQPPGEPAAAPRPQEAASAAPASPAARPVPEELEEAVARAAALQAAPLPIGTMSELMIHLIYPTSDAILYISSRTPTNEVEWNELRAKALTLAESANLLMMPSRVMQPEKQWMQDAQLMLDAGAAAYEAALNQDVPALEELNQQVYESCLVCHFHYRPDYGKSPAP